MSWVRLWHDMPTDPKWRVIAKRSNQTIPNVMAVYTFLLVNASANASERGRTQGWNNEDVAAALDISEDDVSAIIEAMQGKVLDGDYLSGWEKRQPKREDNSAERAKKWREERKRTQTNAQERPDIDADADIDSDKKKEKGGGYAFEGTVIKLNEKHLSQWRKSFFRLDLEAQLTSRDAWLSGQDDAVRKRWFNSTAAWLAKKQEEATTAKKRAEIVEFTGPC